MRGFACDACGAVLFFENDTCLNCGQSVGFRSDDLTMSTVAAAQRENRVRCRNWLDYSACNWFVEVAATYCVSCSVNEVVPDLNDSVRRGLWFEVERAKRRLLYSLLRLELPLADPTGMKQPLRFRLLADERVDTGAVEPPREAVMIGHESGLITLDVAEANDAHREAVRQRVGERYRTVLGHLRHEVGHYYWYLLVDGNTERLTAFRDLFGDERADYETAQRAYYAQAPAQWHDCHVSAYATMHPWEDFAETWAHCLHMLDTLESAATAEFALGNRPLADPFPITQRREFAGIAQDWLRLTVGLNQLSRSMGMRDTYPFALTDPVIEKLAFVHELCRTATSNIHR